MRAIAVRPDRRDVALIEIDEPQITQPTHVKLRMLEAGVCGTDREICAFEYGTPPAGSPHLVIGHESLGEVVEVGAAVRRVAVGDLVVPMVRRPCRHEICVPCRSQRQDFCSTDEFVERGIRGAHGFMTEVVVDDEAYMNPVPRGAREVAVLVEPLTIAEKALQQIWQVQQRLPWACPVRAGESSGYCHQAVILGAGPVGLLGAMAFVANGFETFVYSREDAGHAKARLVESLGAHYLPAPEYPVERVAREIPGLDVVFEATGASALSFRMMQALGPNAIFVFTGVPGRKGPVEVDTDLLMRNLVLRNQVVFGTVNAGREAFEDAIRDIALFQQRWPEPVRSLITGRFPMEAHRDLLLGPPAGIKNVIALA